MAVEYKLGEEVRPDILIKKCTTGFMVKGNAYASDELRAFSTPEGLIEWLSRELGAGPIVWSLTLDIWAEGLGIKPEDLLPVPDPAVDHVGYAVALGSNAAFLLKRFTEAELKKRAPLPPPEPKSKKEKKVKEKRGKDRGELREDFLEVKDLTFPKGSEEEKGGGDQGKG
ncbi:MAG: hypothetical protein Q8O76_00670 [Chloroflexota bacterium]|nr:hypothetical protein [Chloroflexota bacterium]